jgi:hypothetical protein
MNEEKELSSTGEFQVPIGKNGGNKAVRKNIILLPSC